MALLAGMFALITGVNDGGAMLGTGLKMPSVRPMYGLLMLVIAVVVVPAISYRVAVTFTTRLTSLRGEDGRLAMAVAVVVALLVVTVLNQRGQPTSLTLAIVGAITGSGLGWGLPVSVDGVVFVLAVGLLAPFAGATVAAVARRLLVRLSDGRRLAVWHRAGFGLQCLAYAANDGQKMLAVFMVALGFQGAPPAICALIGLLFALGALYGLPRAGRTLSREILASRPLHSVSAELAGGVTVIGCALAGAPVSMTQVIAGGLIGAGMAETTRRIRWPAAMKIVIAWLLTLPVSGVLAAVAALLVKGMNAW